MDRSGTRGEEGQKKRVVDEEVAVELGTKDRGTEKDGLRKLSFVLSGHRREKGKKKHFVDAAATVEGRKVDGGKDQKLEVK